jgi:arylsulfatase
VGSTRRTAFKAAAGALAATGGFLSDETAGRVVASRQESTAATPTASDGRPNILVIFGDDIGYWNISAYNLGQMGYRTPNIDRIAREGVQFTDAYGEQSCTAGRAAFITGQSPFRTGLLKIGLPGDEQGINAEDPTLAELLKPLGYATGQFGKNHLGDRNEFLPTVHGFDEFFGNLYHLNAEEEPENPDYPQDPDFFARYGPRGVLHSWATDVDDPTEDPRFGRVGKQRIENTGPLDTERMQTVDEEFLTATLDFIDRSHEADQPFFVWFNSTRMHIFTHLKPESQGVTGLGVVADGMVEHDGHVGQLLQKLDDLGLTDNTIVIYATDNGAEVFSWPDGGTTPYRSEKNSTWEGAFRIPMLVRWPDNIAAGTISNDMISLQDWVPTLMAAVGVPDIKEQLVRGYQAGEKTFKVHLDGYNQLDHLTAGAENPRGEYFYFSDGGDLTSLRYDHWKAILRVQRAEGLDVWFEPLDELRTPRLINLRTDPFERAIDESANYDTWLVQHLFLLYPVRDYARAFYQTFVEFPPRQSDGPVGRLKEIIELLSKFGG